MVQNEDMLSRKSSPFLGSVWAGVLLLIGLGCGGGGSANTSATLPTDGACIKADLGPGADLKGSLLFPSDNPWNQDISTLPVVANSASIITFIGATAGLKGDFGAGLWEGSPIGIPYVVVSGAQTMVPILYTAYGAESDPGSTFSLTSRALPAGVLGVSPSTTPSHSPLRGLGAELLQVFIFTSNA